MALTATLALGLALEAAEGGARAAEVAVVPHAAVGKMELLDAVELGLGAFGVGMPTGCAAETVLPDLAALILGAPPCHAALPALAPGAACPASCAGVLAARAGAGAGAPTAETEAACLTAFLVAYSARLRGVGAEVRARDASPDTLAYLKEYDAIAALFYAERGTAAAALAGGAPATDAYAGALEAEAAMFETFLDACEPREAAAAAASGARRVAAAAAAAAALAGLAAAALL